MSPISSSIAAGRRRARAGRVAGALARTVVEHEQRGPGDERDAEHVDEGVRYGRSSSNARTGIAKQARGGSRSRSAGSGSVLDQQQQDTDHGAEDDEDDRDLHERAHCRATGRSGEREADDDRRPSPRGEEQEQHHQGEKDGGDR
jgi:hypothetical protein